MIRRRYFNPPSAALSIRIHNLHLPTPLALQSPSIATLTQTMLDPSHPIAELLARDDRYPFDAYVFVFEALRHAQEKMGMGTEYLNEDYQPSDEDLDEPERHVSGQELCEAMRQYAHEQYGYLAKSVLNHWSIYSTGDFGEIVFNLIEIEQMRKTPNDRREDFDNVFDFDEGFQHSFQFSMPDSTEERRS